ncbi:TPA: suppressor of fused domain protein [Stenotrophomonas maltophilia]
MSTIDDDTLLERSWEYREETLYRRLFGDTGPGIYPLDMDLLRNVFKQEQIDPRWLHVGVNACPPHGDRRHWIYVSTGLSNPWEGRHEDGDSGWGIELMLETQDEATWALTTLRWFTAYHLLLCHSRMPGNPLAPWDRLKLGGGRWITQGACCRRPSSCRHCTFRDPSNCHRDDSTSCSCCR